MFLAAVKVRFPDEVLADFQQFYGLDIDQLRPLRAAALATQLPAGSRVMKQLDWRNSWSGEQYALALIVDEIEALRYELGAGKGKKPKPLPRPKREAPKPKKHEFIGRRHLDYLLFEKRGVKKNGIDNR